MKKHSDFILFQIFFHPNLFFYVTDKINTFSAEINPIFPSRSTVSLTLAHKIDFKQFDKSGQIAGNSEFKFIRLFCNHNKSHVELIDNKKVSSLPRVSYYSQAALDW